MLKHSIFTTIYPKGYIVVGRVGDDKLEAPINLKRDDVPAFIEALSKIIEVLKNE